MTTLGIDQLLLVALDLRNVGTERNETTVAGALLVDLQPAAILYLCLESLGIAVLTDLRRYLRLDPRLAAYALDLVIGGALTIALSGKL